MSGKRWKYTPQFREQAARLVIETGRPAAHLAAEIDVGEQYWVVGCAWPARRATTLPTATIGIATATWRQRLASRGTSRGPRRCRDRN